MAEAAKIAGFTIGEWTVEPDLGLIRRGDDATALEPRVMDLLVYLASRAGDTVPTEELAGKVWAGRAISDQPVYQGIAQLRKALHDEARNPRYIATVTKKGYRLIAAVGTVNPAIITESASRVLRRRPRFFAPVLSLILASSYLFLSSSDVSVSLERSTMAPLPFGSIAVLPFVDMSPDQSQQYLGDGIAEELIHRIAAVPDVEIVARTSSFSFRDSDANVQEIGEQLGADYILEGSVRRSGARLRITAQLVSADDGYHVWSQSYEPIMTESFAIQDQIAGSVARLLQAGGGGVATPGRSWTQSADAADAYYLGVFHMHKRRAESLNLAIGYFRKAIEYDPAFALAYAALSKAYFLASDIRYGNVPDDEAERESRAATEMAGSLDDRLPEVLERLASDAWDRGDLAATEALILRAIEINPNYAPAYKVYGKLLSELDRRQESLEVLKKAVALDPLSPVLRINLGRAFAGLNRSSESEAQYLKAIELDPDWHLAYYGYGLTLTGGQFARTIDLGRKAYTIEGPGARMAADAAMLVAYAYLSIEDFAAAGEWYRKAQELNVDSWWLANETMHLLIAQDRYGEADALLSEWEAKQTDRINVYRFGGLYRAVMGQHGAAIAMLEHAASMSDSGAISSLYEDSNLRWGYMPAVQLARLYMITGRKQEGIDLLDKAEEQILKVENASPGLPGADYVHASIHALRGNRRNAIRSLRRAADSGWTRAWFLERDPVFEDYRDDPQFGSILLQMRTHIAAERNKLAKLAGDTP